MSDYHDMDHDPATLERLVETMAVPGRETLYPRGVRVEHHDELSAKPILALDAAIEAIRLLSARGVATPEGEILEQTATGLEPLRSAPGIPSELAANFWGGPPSRWRCPRKSDEGWAEYVARCAGTFLAPLEALAAEIVLGRSGEYFADIGYITADELTMFEVPGYIAGPLWSRSSRDAQDRLAEVSNARNSDNIRGFLAGAAAGSFVGRAAESLDGIPADAEYLCIDARAADLTAISHFTALTHLVVIGPNQRALEQIGRLGQLRVLDMIDVRGTSLDALGAMPNVEILRCSAPPRLSDISVLTSWPKLWCAQLGLRGVRDLVGIARCESLRELSMTEYGLRFPTLAPLAGLSNLRRLSLWGVRVGDGALTPLGQLRQLERLSVETSAFKLYEFAELAAMLPETDGPHRSPWGFNTLLAQVKPCPTCGGAGGHVTIGKPNRGFCFACDAAKIAKHVARWEVLVSAARARLAAAR